MRHIQYLTKVIPLPSLCFFRQAPINSSSRHVIPFLPFYFFWFKKKIMIIKKLPSRAVINSFVPLSSWKDTEKLKSGNLCPLVMKSSAKRNTRPMDTRVFLGGRGSTTHILSASGEKIPHVYSLGVGCLIKGRVFARWQGCYDPSSHVYVWWQCPLGE